MSYLRTAILLAGPTALFMGKYGNSRKVFKIFTFTVGIDGFNVTRLGNARAVIDQVPINGLNDAD